MYINKSNFHNYITLTSQRNCRLTRGISFESTPASVLSTTVKETGPESGSGKQVNNIKT